MKFRKEIITGISTVLAILLLVTGVNFLKGNSFFGGDDIYYAYFPNTAGVTPSNSVYYNGVIIGKILNVELNDSEDSLRRVKIMFNIQESGFKIPKSSELQAGGAENDFLGKGIIILPNKKNVQGNYALGSHIQGVISKSLQSQIETYIDPIEKNLNFVLGNLTEFTDKLAAFWDTTASSEMERSMQEVRIAIKKFGNAAAQIEDLVVTEKVKISRIMSNVTQITENLKKSNEVVKEIVGNVKTITDDLVTADFKGIITDARVTLQEINGILESAQKGNGTLGKLIHDESLYNELVETNQSLQNLVDDLQLHPERYIHFSVFGSKSKSSFTPDQEKKLKKMADNALNND